MAVSPDDEQGEVRYRRADLALGFGKMVIKKRGLHPKIQFQVVVCFGCGALIGRTDRNFVSIFWNDGNPDLDEVVTPHRATTVRMCTQCRIVLVRDALLVCRVGDLEIKLVLNTTNEMSKTSAHGVLPTRGMRRVRQWQRVGKEI